MRGASVLQALLDEAPHSGVQVFVVWQSILPSDWTRPGSGILTRVHDTRARQFWDKDNLFPSKLGERIRMDKDHPEPNCCWQDDIPWDMVAIYAPGARWEEALPAAVFVDGPVYAVKAEMVAALQEQINAAPRKEGQ